MHSARTSPTARPASRIACRASGSPARASETTSRLDCAGRPAALSLAASAAPPATASRQPRVPAAADDVVVAGHANVPDVSGRALRAAVHAAVGHDPAPDPGADHHVQQVLDLAPVHPVLAERHHVDVVVDQRRRVVVAREPARDREAVPARQPARRDRLATAHRDRGRDADPDAPDLRRADAGRAQQLAEARVDGVEPDRGRLRDVELEGLLDQRRARQITDRGAAVGYVDISHKHNAS